MDKAKNVVKDKGKGQQGVDFVKPDMNGEQQGIGEPVDQASEEAATVVDGSKDAKQDKDAKRAILRTLGDIADLHERIKK
jgi:hypothetical protein